MFEIIISNLFHLQLLRVNFELSILFKSEISEKLFLLDSFGIWVCFYSYFHSLLFITLFSLLLKKYEYTYYLWLTKNQFRHIIFYDVLCGLFPLKKEAIKHTDYIEENNPTMYNLNPITHFYPRIFFICL